MNVAFVMFNFPLTYAAPPITAVFSLNSQSLMEASFSKYAAPPEFARLPVNFEVSIFPLFLKYKAPPLSVALFSMNVEFVMSPLIRYAAPPFWFAMFFVKVEFFIFAFDAYTAPPSNALLFVKLQFSIVMSDRESIAPPLSPNPLTKFIFFKTTFSPKRLNILPIVAPLIVCPAPSMTRLFLSITIPFM